MTTDVVLQYSPEIKEDVDDLDKKRKETPPGAQA